MPKREAAQREMERRIVAQMLTCMDDLNGGDAGQGQPDQPRQQGQEDDPVATGTVGNAHVVVIGAFVMLTPFVLVDYLCIDCIGQLLVY